MNRLIAVFFLSVSVIGGSGQGLINFANNPNTLITAGSDFGLILHGTYYFALLTSPVGANTFSFAGAYATNVMSPGRFSGGFGVAISGWPAATSRDFEVVGWSANLGTTFNAAWLSGTFGSVNGFFGVSSVG